MIDRFRYRRAPLVDPYQIKNERLFITFLLVTQGVFAAFGVLSILTEKTFAGSVNLFGGAVLALILLGYARFGSFRMAVGAFITIAMIIVAVQHVVTPPALGANLLWMCPLVFIAVYMAGIGVGSIVAVISTVVMLVAEMVKAWRPVVFEGFSDADVFFFEISTIVLSSLATLIIALRVAREERTAFSRLREQSRALRERKNENENLVYLLSHDIANPLQVIFSNSEEMAESIAESQSTPASLADQLSQIDEASDRISDIITQVREYKALDSGKVSVELDSIDLIDAVEVCLARFEEDIEEKRLRVAWEVPAARPINVLADWTSLTISVLGNLISNAIKFSHPESTIQLGVVPEEDGRVVLWIEDQGVGIPGPLMPLLFAPDVSTNRKGTEGESGTGFGLPIVKMFVDKYGGTIEVGPGSGDPDRPGTRFELGFRAAQSPERGD
ncbi:MAG: sensor histidine kinase [Myxococcota bacterium]